MRIKRGKVWHTLNARRTFHGRPRFDTVHVRGDSDEAPQPWLARLLALIKVDVPDGQDEHIAEPGYVTLAIIQWLDRREDDEIVPGVRQYHYLPQPQVIELAAVEQPVWLVENPVAAPDGAFRLCALPYGKSAARNAMF